MLETAGSGRSLRVSLLRGRIEQHRRGLAAGGADAGEAIGPLGAIYYGEPITDGEAEGR